MTYSHPGSLTQFLSVVDMADTGDRLGTAPRLSSPVHSPVRCRRHDRPGPLPPSMMFVAGSSVSLPGGSSARKEEKKTTPPPPSLSVRGEGEQGAAAWRPPEWGIPSSSSLQEVSDTRETEIAAGGQGMKEGSLWTFPSPLSSSGESSRLAPLPPRSRHTRHGMLAVTPPGLSNGIGPATFPIPSSPSSPSSRVPLPSPATSAGLGVGFPSYTVSIMSGSEPAGKRWVAAGYGGGAPVVCTSCPWCQKKDARQEADHLVEADLLPGLQYLEKVFDHPANGTELLFSPWLEWLWNAFGPVVMYRRTLRRSRQERSHTASRERKAARKPLSSMDPKKGWEEATVEEINGTHQKSTARRRRGHATGEDRNEPSSDPPRLDRRWTTQRYHYPERVAKPVTLLFRHIVRRMTVLDMASNPRATVILRLKSLPQDTDVIRTVLEEVCRHFLARNEEGAAELKHDMQKAQRMIKNLDLLFSDVLPHSTAGARQAGGFWGGAPMRSSSSAFPSSTTRTVIPVKKPNPTSSSQDRRRSGGEDEKESSRDHVPTVVETIFTISLGADMMSAINAIALNNGPTLRRFMKNETSLFVLRDNIAHHLLLHIPSFHLADEKVLGKVFEVCTNDARITMVLLWRLVKAVKARNIKEVQSVVYFIIQWVAVSIEGRQLVMATIGREGEPLAMLLGIRSLPSGGGEEGDGGVEGRLMHGEDSWSERDVSAVWYAPPTSSSASFSPEEHVVLPVGGVIMENVFRDHTTSTRTTSATSTATTATNSGSGTTFHAAFHSSFYANLTSRVIEWCRQHAVLWSFIAQRVEQRATQVIQEAEDASSVASYHPLYLHDPHPQTSGRGSQSSHTSGGRERGRSESGARLRQGVGNGMENMPTNNVPSEWELQLQKARKKHELHRQETQGVVQAEWNELCRALAELFFLPSVSYRKR